MAVPITDYTVKSCQFLNPWDWLSKCSFRFANWHPVRRQQYRDVYHIPRYAFTWTVGYTMCKWFLFEDIRYLKVGFASMTAIIVDTPSNDICTMKSLNHASSMQELKCSFSITFYIHYSNSNTQNYNFPLNKPGTSTRRLTKVVNFITVSLVFNSDVCLRLGIKCCNNFVACFRCSISPHFFVVNGYLLNNRSVASA